MVKTLNKLEKERKFLCMKKGKNEKLSANTILYFKRLKPFPVKSGIRQELSLLPFVFNIVVKLPTRAIS